MAQAENPDPDLVERAINERLDEHIENVLKLIRQPSIAAENRGIEECAKLVRNLFKWVGCTTTEIFRTPGMPVVYGHLDCGAKTTILVYLMYDVKQVEGQRWTLVKDPFEPKVVEMPPFKRVIAGRGAVNSKGPMMAFLNAVRTVMDIDGKLPVNLKFVAEGEEEISSPHLYGFIVEHEELFRNARAVIMPLASQNIKGEVSLHLGCKGVYELELECSGESWGRGPTKDEIHSSYAPLVESPVWRLVNALATMKADPIDPELVTVKGFYDDIRAPGQNDRALLETLAKRVDFDSIKSSLGVKRFYNDLSGTKALERLLYTPTLNIQGIKAGYTGPSFMTILPSRAKVKLEVRLVPEMSAERVNRVLTEHLRSRGFGDIRVIATDDDFGRAVGEKWAITDPASPCIQAAVTSYKELGYDPEVWPRMAGTAPLHAFTNPPLGLPLVIFGLGHGARAHAPDEYYVVEGSGLVKGLAGAEYSYVRLLMNLARAYENS